MGCFDTIRCDYPLPLPQDQGELLGKDWGHVEFQTKDLGEGMGCYHIRKDGTLWFLGLSFDSLRSAAELEKQPRRPTPGAPSATHQFGTVEFYKGLRGQRNDFQVEWRATFAGGKLVTVELSRWEARDNADRLQREAAWAAEEERTVRFLKSWVGRWLYPSYAWVVGVVLAKAVVGGTNILCSGLHKLQGLAWNLEPRLAPHGNPIEERRRARRFEQSFRELEEEFGKEKL